jgi:hypothetical protein
MQNHKLGQKKAKRKLVASTGRVSFATPKLKDECFGSLNETDQQKAAEAERKNELSELNGKLRCDTCGQSVGAMKNPAGSNFVPFPRSHERFTVKRQRPSKPGPRKTF